MTRITLQPLHLRTSGVAWLYSKASAIRTLPTMTRNVSLLLLAIAAAVVLGGCNTIQGAGKDIQKAGEKIEDAARR